MDWMFSDLQFVRVHRRHRFRFQLILVNQKICKCFLINLDERHKTFEVYLWMLVTISKESGHNAWKNTSGLSFKGTYDAEALATACLAVGEQAVIETFNGTGELPLSDLFIDCFLVSVKRVHLIE